MRADLPGAGRGRRNRGREVSKANASNREWRSSSWRLSHDTARSAAWQVLKGHTRSW